MKSSNKAISLSKLAPAPGSTQTRKRVGFGDGSGLGKTCGKGGKGQRGRSGFSLRPGFEGGQMPLHRRLPKRGFTSRKKVLGKNIYSTINLAQLTEIARDGIVTLDAIKEAGFIRSRAARVKILAVGELKGKISVEAHAASAAAKTAIESAGGQLKLLA